MITKTMIGTAVIMALAVCVACSDDTEPTADARTPDAAADLDSPDGPLADMAPDGAVPDTGAPDLDATITITGKLSDFPAVNTPVSGVDVCVHGISSVPCVKSDTTGAFSLPKVPDKDVLLSLKKTGYLPYAVAHGGGQLSTDYTLNVASDKTVTQMLAAVSVTKKAGKGHIICDGGPLAGTTFNLSKSVGDGPFYFDGSGVPDKSLTATSSFGLAFIVNVDPGDYEVTFANSGKTCSLSSGWKGTSSSKTKVKVLADAATLFTLSCK